MVGRTGYIDDIFQIKDDTGRYTEDAVLLQDLLRYSLVINKVPSKIAVSFKKRELQKWTVIHNQEISSYYNDALHRRNTTYSNRIHGMRSKLNSKFEILLSLNLIMQEGTSPAEKIKASVPLFKYTMGGLLLALIIKAMDIKEVVGITKSDKANNEHQNELNRIQQNIFETFQLAFKTTKSSPARDIFYSCLIQQSMERGVFDNLISRIQDTITSDVHIVNVTDLLLRSFYSSSFEGQSKIEFLNVFWETIKDLDEDVKNLILFQIKGYAESKFEKRQENVSREYEEYRFKLRSDYKRIAIEGYCNNCRLKQVIGINYLDIKRISAARADATNWTCPVCSTKKSLVVPSFLY